MTCAEILSRFDPAMRLVTVRKLQQMATQSGRKSSFQFCFMNVACGQVHCSRAEYVSGGSITFSKANHTKMKPSSRRKTKAEDVLKSEKPGRRAFDIVSGRLMPVLKAKL